MWKRKTILKKKLRKKYPKTEFILPDLDGDKIHLIGRTRRGCWLCFRASLSLFISQTQLATLLVNLMGAFLIGFLTKWSSNLGNGNFSEPSG